MYIVLIKDFVAEEEYLYNERSPQIAPLVLNFDDINTFYSIPPWDTKVCFNSLKKQIKFIAVLIPEIYSKHVKDFMDFNFKYRKATFTHLLVSSLICVIDFTSGLLFFQTQKNKIMCHETFDGCIKLNEYIFAFGGSISEKPH